MRIRTLIMSMTMLFDVVLAGTPSANADMPAMNGTYRYTDDKGNVGTWIIKTTCSSGCRADVTTSPGHGFTASLVDGVYTVNRTVPNGVTCPNSFTFFGETGISVDGGSYSVSVRQWWDASTLAGGTDYLDSAAPCAIFPSHDTFVLKPIG